MERVEADKLIFKFVKELNPNWTGRSLPADDWNYIMAVVEFIENGLPNSVKFKFVIDLSSCKVHNLSNFPFDTKLVCPVDIISLQDKQDAVVSAIAKWITWYGRVYQGKCGLCGEKSNPDLVSGCDRMNEVGCNWYQKEVTEKP